MLKNKKNKFYIILVIILFNTFVFNQEQELELEIYTNPSGTDYWWLNNNNYGITNSELLVGFSWDLKQEKTSYKLNLFGGIDSENKTYANLRLTEKVGISGNIVDNPVTELPTESEVNAKLKELQDAWDLNYGATSYKNKRRGEYPKIPEQLDKLYHDMTAGKLDATGEWYKSIKAIKDKYPKE